MRLILATSNQDKQREIQEIYAEFAKKFGVEILCWDKLITPFEIEEDGESFQENALIKSKAVFEALKVKGILTQKDIVLSDDSGICVEKLGGKPGIHSARYSGGGALENLEKLRGEIESLGGISNAHYCACIGISSYMGDYSVHGFMYGQVIAQCRGENGFGYDPIFIPNGFKQTLAELSNEEKNAISHRRIALENALYVLCALL
ncbi:non-canonical purine NTP pyrophosphatase [Helicobacter sp. MIT 05-5294]|uniref:non-canonical purine NTP pyrophosphatase n=1 Tax=Helicobacter sp. MIT 05-5294 TaxID=1548150 RepID=UPI00051FF26D|nr:non-canonical purine NTP pyrophosphatase [Helicobacter sp. MIT 05-5294]TLD85627.1 non-canonical purine NTP pyrophosphatase [Helicobacter sp. MIT 05-5294]